MKKPTDLPHGCSIDGCTSPRWKKGGRAGADGKPELCPKHYHRERRESPDAKVAGDVVAAKRKPVMFRPSAEVLAALEAWHVEALKKYADVSQGNLVERAVEEALRKRGHLPPLKRA